MFPFLEEYYASLRESREEGVDHGNQQADEKASYLEVMSTRSDRSDYSPASQKRRERKSADPEMTRRRLSSTPLIPGFKSLSSSEVAVS